MSDTSFVELSGNTSSPIEIYISIDNFLTISNGDVVVNTRYYQKMKDKLVKV